MPTYHSCLCSSIKECNIFDQAGFPLFFCLLEGMVIHNIERGGDLTHLERYGLQLQGTRWPLVTNYGVIIPGETDV